jgi:serine/threonine protein kinase
MSPLDGTTGRDGEPGAEDADSRIGAVVDKYTIVRLLGKGGMGAVYEARHAKLARRFAIKFLLPELAAKREILRRFENEAKAAGGLEHANLAAVTDFGSAADGSPYIVMEFLQGEDCSKLLHRMGPLPVPRATDIVMQACRGLAVAHKAGIIHRDLKPENIFLADAGDGSDLVKVLDFGIAKLRSAEGSLATSTGTTFGTAHYMSPEQARAASEVDERTDVWSLGIVLYELLSCRTPFEGEQFLHVIHEILTSEPPALATLRPGLPPALGGVVKRAMAKDVARRFPTVTALAEALSPFAKREAAGRPAARGAPAPTQPTPATGASRVSPYPTGTRTPRRILRGSGAVARIGATQRTIIGIVTAAVAGIAILLLRINHQAPRSFDRQRSVAATTAPPPGASPAAPSVSATPVPLRPPRYSQMLWIVMG